MAARTIANKREVGERERERRVEEVVGDGIR